MSKNRIIYSRDWPWYKNAPGKIWTFLGYWKLMFLRYLVCSIVGHGKTVSVHDFAAVNKYCGRCWELLK